MPRPGDANGGIDVKTRFYGFFYFGHVFLRFKRFFRFFHVFNVFNVFLTFI